MARRSTVVAGVKPVGKYTLAWAHHGKVIAQSVKPTIGHVGLPNGITPCGAHNGPATATRTNAAYVPGWGRGMVVHPLCLAWCVANAAAITYAAALAAAQTPAAPTTTPTNGNA